MTTTDGDTIAPDKPYGSHLVTPWSPSLGRYMTVADWRNYMATLAEDYRRALPRPIEFLINTPWNAALNQGGATQPDIQRVFKVATWMNIESGWTERQRTTVTTLEHAARDAEAAGVRPPAIVVVGEVVRLHDALGDLAGGSLTP